MHARSLARVAGQPVPYISRASSRGDTCTETYARVLVSVGTGAAERVQIRVPRIARDPLGPDASARSGSRVPHGGSRLSFIARPGEPGAEVRSNSERSTLRSTRGQPRANASRGHLRGSRGVFPRPRFYEPVRRLFSRLPKPEMEG